MGHKIVIVYRHALLRDMYTQLFVDAGFCVVAAIPNGELTSLSLVGVDSDVIVSDEATAETVGMITTAILFSPSRASVSKLIAVGVGQLISVDFKKEVMNDAGIEDLLAQARRQPGMSISLPTNDLDQIVGWAARDSDIQRVEGVL